ncbi:response regulator transcription factor [Prolixibacteraceae bacterium JC049]|nr:response regulator transcription factor [Prolixibacteraceae bacterium JC049]
MNLNNIAIIDNDFFFRSGLLHLFENEFPSITVSGFNTTDEFSSYSILNSYHPDLIIYGGLFYKHQQVEEIKNLLQFDNKLLIVSSHTFDFIIHQLIELNIVGFLTKTTSQRQFTEAIHAISEDKKYFNKEALQLIHSEVIVSTKSAIKKKQHLTLNTIELKVLELTCQGFTAQEIAPHVELSARTVEGYRRKLLKKTNTKSTAHLTLYAICNHIIDINEFCN